MMQSNAQPIYNNFFQQNNNNMNYIPQQNNMSQMSQQQMQLFEIQKMQARQLGGLLKKQKELVERMKRNEEQKQNEDREVIPNYFLSNFFFLINSVKKPGLLFLELESI